VQLCRQETDKPFSVKIRIGWDRRSLNAVEVTQAAESGGADWITVHGRTRDCGYGEPVDLNWIRKVKEATSMPVIGNGNLFGHLDGVEMKEKALVDGLMVSRGALGNPWIFDEMKGIDCPLTLDAWLHTVLQHLEWQRQTYGNQGMSAVCMRKHLLWYTKGWLGGKKAREAINKTESLEEAESVLKEFYQYLKGRQEIRRSVRPEGGERFAWDPKYDMDRSLDRGVYHAAAQEGAAE
jgi:tRNA-dihydrouridine synthase B